MRCCAVPLPIELLPQTQGVTLAQIEEWVMLLMGEKSQPAYRQDFQLLDRTGSEKVSTRDVDLFFQQV